jgi:hypothetical protein
MRHDGAFASDFRLIATVPTGEDSDRQGDEHPNPIMLDHDPAILEVPKLFHPRSFVS